MMQEAPESSALSLALPSTSKSSSFVISLCIDGKWKVSLGRVIFLSICLMMSACQEMSPRSQKLRPRNRTSQGRPVPTSTEHHISSEWDHQCARFWGFAEVKKAWQKCFIQCIGITNETRGDEYGSKVRTLTFFSQLREEPPRSNKPGAPKTPIIYFVPHEHTDQYSRSEWLRCLNEEAFDSSDLSGGSGLGVDING